jgi:type IV pilus assembly protein PilP
MKNVFEHLIRLALLCLLATPSQAQEKNSQKAPEQTQNKNAPAALGQTITQSIQDIGKSVSSTLGLGGKETKATPAVAPVPPVAPPADDKKKVESPQVLITPVGRRDPFRPFTLNTRASPMRKRENLSPLERYELGQLKLVGIVADPRNSNALVEDASGLGYVVKLGTPIGVNDGKVVAIRRDAIVIEELYVDLYGAQKKREVNLKLLAENSE